MFYRGRSGNGQHDGRPLQKPGQGYLRAARTVRLRDLVQHFAGNPAGCEWEPGDKSNSITLTIVHYVVPLTVGEAIAVLHRHDGNNFAGSLDMLLRDVGQCDQANLTFISQFGQSFHRGLEGHHWIWSVQLINVDAIQAQSLEAARPLREGVSELHRESTDLDQDDSSLPWSQSPDRAGKETTTRQSRPHLRSGHKNRQCR